MRGVLTAFCRKKGETLQDYLHRHRQLVLKLQEVQLPLPDGLIGWHLLSRAGIPQWQEPTVKSACGNKLEPKRVEEVLKQMFGADSRPHAKDVARVSRNVAGATYDAMVAEDDFGVDQYAIADSWDDGYNGHIFGYGYEDQDDAYEVYDDEDEGYYEDEEAYFEDEVPPELEEAADRT